MADDIPERARDGRALPGDFPLPGAAASMRKLPNQRTMARLAAVQALYQMDIAGTDLDAIIEEYEQYRLGAGLVDPQGAAAESGVAGGAAADAGWFRTLVRGTVAQQRTLDPMIDRVLSRDWPLFRVESILRAVLRAGAYELGHRPDVPARVILNEYLNVAHRFHEEAELRLINGTLDRLAHQMRGDELSGQDRPPDAAHCAPPAAPPATPSAAPPAAPSASARPGKLPSV